MATDFRTTELKGVVAGSRLNESDPIPFHEYEISGPASLRAIISEIRGKAGSITGETSDLRSSVSEIVGKVQSGGDAALLELSAKYDRTTSFSSAASLLATRDELDLASESLTAAQKKAIRVAYAQIRWLARAQKKRRYLSRVFRTPLGFVVKESFVPLGRIGGYVPGGLACYPSTILMICGPAREAGVNDIILASPPGPSGALPAALLYAANLCGVREVVKLGGAQAIAALAYGSETIRRVELIAGPGNQYVTEAKRQVAASGIVRIDSLAGPTELLVLADGKADPTLVSEDLISQAEHGNRTLIGVVSDSAQLLQRTKEAMLSTLSRGRERLDHIRQSYIFSAKARSMEEAEEFARAFAPEHLEVQADQPQTRLTSAGLILRGKYTPCSATDYIVGTDHILPTGGQAASSSGISVETFLRRVTVVESSKRALGSALEPLSELARLEGLPNHAAAAAARFRHGTGGREERSRKSTSSRERKGAGRGGRVASP